MAVIEARQVIKEFPYRGDAVHALRGVDLAVDRGEHVAVAGPSGCGKSTLLNVLAGIEPPTSGSVELLAPHACALDEGARPALRLRKEGSSSSALDNAGSADQSVHHFIEQFNAL